MNNAKFELSSEYATVGDTALIMSQYTVNTAYYLGFISLNEIGKTVTFTADVYCTTICHIKIYTLIDGTYLSKYTTIPANTMGTYSIQHTIPSNTGRIIYRIEPRDYSSLDNFASIDNIQLYVS